MLNVIVYLKKTPDTLKTSVKQRERKTLLAKATARSFQDEKTMKE